MAESQQDPVKVADSIITNSVHLATFLGTMGCKPVQIHKGPERTQLGYPITKWEFENDGRAEEIYGMWGKPSAVAPSWETYPDEVKQLVIDIITAHSDNLRHFLQEAKRNG